MGMEATGHSRWDFEQLLAEPWVSRLWIEIRRRLRRESGSKTDREDARLLLKLLCWKNAFRESGYRVLRIVIQATALATGIGWRRCRLSSAIQSPCSSEPKI